MQLVGRMHPPIPPWIRHCEQHEHQQSCASLENKQELNSPATFAHAYLSVTHKYIATEHLNKNRPISLYILDRLIALRHISTERPLVPY